VAGNEKKDYEKSNFLIAMQSASCSYGNCCFWQNSSASATDLHYSQIRVAMGQEHKWSLRFSFGCRQGVCVTKLCVVMDHLDLAILPVQDGANEGLKKIAPGILRLGCCSLFSLVRRHRKDCRIGGFDMKGFSFLQKTLCFSEIFFSAHKQNTPIIGSNDRTGFTCYVWSVRF
jgi:hypothetical protein